MPAVLHRRQASQFGDSLTTGKIVGIALASALITMVLCIYFYRRRLLRKKQAEASRNSRRFLKTTFPRPALDPALPPYEPPREIPLSSMSPVAETRRSRGNSAGSGSRSGTSTPRELPPARVSTPPGYGQHVADRPAGPLSELPPAYREHEEISWGRSGCPR